MPLDLKNLELFVRVAALKGIGRAGEELGLSATNSSLRLQALEEELGAKLLNRTTRSVSLTADGDVFLEHAKRVLDEVEEAKSILSSSEASLTGTLRVTAPATFARTHIVPFLPEFSRRFPELVVDLHLSDGIIDIVEQGFDLAFRIGELAPSTLLARKIDDNPECLVASPAYIERFGMPETPADLSQHNCLPLGRNTTWRLKGRDDKIQAIHATGSIYANLGDAISDLVLAGVGVGHASLWRAGNDLRAGALVPVLPDYRLAPETKIWAVRSPGRNMPKRVQFFLEFMQGQIRETNEQCYGDLLKTLFARKAG
ncbi:MAG: LysR substrate-binding domain-containing protein [Yoonia sp.]|uniref:LysR family transcriptional regulator n=1 Tax=Yoonia sp. TaxID=2212373 RepID=UPI00326427C9